MNSLNDLLGLISNVMQSKDTNLRKNAEATIVQLRKTNPNEIIVAYLQILEANYQNDVKHFVASQLKYTLSKYCPSSYDNIWPKLIPDVQQQVKVKLFEAVAKENDLNLKKYFGSTLGEIAGSILDDTPDAWPSFKSDLWILFNLKEANAPIAAFKVLERFLDLNAEHFKNDFAQLFGLYVDAISSSNKDIKLAALEAYPAFMELYDSKECKKEWAQLQTLVIPIYQATYILIKDHKDETGLENLSDMIDASPRYFKKNFKELYELLFSIFQLGGVEVGVKRMCTEILVDYSEKYPALFRSHPEILSGLVEMIFFHMGEISEEVTSEWMSPPEGYNEDMEDDDDFETTRFGMGAIDRIILCVGSEEVIPILNTAITKILALDNWRYKYTATMALSQVGEYIDDPEKIVGVMQMIRGFLKNPHPMIRYSACHAIGQISDDMKPKFQEKFGAEILPELIELLNDQVPRVVGHSAAALTNFLEGVTIDQIKPYAQVLMERFLILLTNGISLVRECCLSAISSVVEILKGDWLDYFQNTVSIIFNFFTVPQFQTKEYQQLKGQCIETLTIIASSIGGEAFKPVANQLIDLLIKLQCSEMEQTDPQKHYILAGWQRLCLVYGKELAGYLNNILPSLFKLVENVIDQDLNPKISNSSTEEEADVDDGLNTFENESVEIALSMLNVFIKELGEMFGPYIEKCVNLVVKIIEEHPNDAVKEEACECMPNIIKATKGSNNSISINLTKHFMNILFTNMSKEYDPNVVIIELETLKEIIETLDLCFLSENELSEFSEKMLIMLKNSEEKKSESVKTKIEEQAEIDDDEKEMIEGEIETEEELQVAISELIGSLFKTHKSMTIGLAQFLIANILPKTLRPGQSVNSLKFGIFLIDDMVEFLGYELLQERWESFGMVMMEYALSKNHVLRQAACYGLGIYACRTPAMVLNYDLIVKWLTVLTQSADVPKGSEKEKAYHICRDNAIASIGKIVKTHAGAFQITNFLNYWFNNLPLRHDKEEAIEQHEFLADIMIANSDLLLGVEVNQRVEMLKRALNLYGEILGNVKIHNESIKKKIKDSLYNFYNDNTFKTYSTEIWKGLSDRIKNNLNQVLK